MARERTKQLNVKLTPEEMEKAKAKATASGLTISEYLRVLLLRHRLEVLWDDETKEM